MRGIDLFCGIGGLRLGCAELVQDWIWACDKDAVARNVYQANFGERPIGEIRDISLEADVPAHDFLCAGFPCQPFSIIGKGRGFADRRGTLFFFIERILRIHQPRAFLLENVKRLVTHSSGDTFGVIQRTLRRLGYTLYWQVLNSLDYGVPQKRERVYIVGIKDEHLPFTFPERLAYRAPLSSILESSAGSLAHYQANPRIVAESRLRLKKNPPRPAIWHRNISGNVSALPYSCALRAGASHNYLLVNGERRLTEREMLRLQGFPESFNLNCTYTQARRLLGNSVTVPVVAAIAGQLKQSLTGEQHCNGK